ncbi:hypothetical protein [Iodobacter ciconiae]|uniref:hypothetical protein n=1 Tax=Iodobacter ciconiae TaxID=2496266 RepID=UPI0013DFD73F|nr:hypothetical protein [Iodobacter ciconiae]
MKSLFVLSLCLTLSACGPGPAPNKIAEPQREALEKAKQVEGIVLKQAAEQASAAENN